MTVTHKVVVKMSPIARVELSELVSKINHEYNDSYGRVTQSSAVEAALYYWLQMATLDEQRAAFRETSGEQTTAVTFQLTNESGLRTACGGNLAIERIRAGLSYPSLKDTLRAVIKCFTNVPKEDRLNALVVVRRVGPAVDIDTAQRSGHHSRQLEQEAVEDSDQAA